MTPTENPRARLRRLTADVLADAVRAILREDHREADEEALAAIRRATQGLEVRVVRGVVEGATDAELREALRVEIEPALRRAVAAGRPS